MSYNGWANYETWAVVLWLDNDEGSYRYCRELAERAIDEAGDCRQVEQGIWTEEQAARFTLADALEQEHTEGMPELSGVYSDLLLSALGSVDWHEVAAHYIDGVREMA